MKILVSERLSEHMYKTPEGYLVCVDSILARTGKQEYRKSEIFNNCDDDSLIEVDRSAEQVFSPQTLASFENKPITIQHPDEDVNVSNYHELSVGFARDIRQADDNGQPVMMGTLIITDNDAIEKIESGELKELSCGYDCDIEDSENPEQTNIRGNHIALCEKGRAGIARIVDSISDNVDEHTYTVGWVRRSTDQSEYTDVKATSEHDACALIKNFYRKEVYRIFECKLKDKETNTMNDTDITKLDEAIKGEVDTIKLYDKMIAEEDDEEMKSHLIEIRNDEKDHLKILIAQKSKTHDSVRDTIPAGYISVLYTYDGDKASNFESTLTVKATNNDEALRKAKAYAMKKFPEKNPGNFRITNRYYTNAEVVDSVRDTREVYTIHWQDLTAKQKGLGKLVNHETTIGATSYHEALEKLMKDVVLDGIGTNNALVLTMRNQHSTYQYSGRLSELLKTVKDSNVCDDKYREAVKMIKNIAKTKNYTTSQIVAALKKNFPELKADYQDIIEEAIDVRLAQTELDAKSLKLDALRAISAVKVISHAKTKIRR